MDASVVHVESHDTVPRHSLRYEPLGREGVNVGAAEVATPSHPGQRQILIPISVKYGERDDYRVGRYHPNSEGKFGISYEKAKLSISAQVCQTKLLEKTGDFFARRVFFVGAFQSAKFSLPKAGGMKQK